LNLLLVAATAILAAHAARAQVPGRPPFSPSPPPPRIEDARPTAKPEQVPPGEARPVDRGKAPGEPVGPRERFELFEFRDLPLSQALRLFSEQTGVNVVASEQASTKTVSLYLRNVTASTALDALAKAHGLWTRRDEETDVVHIYTIEEYNRDLAAFRDEQTEVFTLLYPNPVDVAQTIEAVFGDRVLLTLGQQQQDHQFQELEQRFERFDLIDERSEGLGLFGTEGLGASTGGSRGSRSSQLSGLGQGRNRGQGFLRDTRASQQRAATRELPRFEQLEDLTPEEIAVLEAYYSERPEDVDESVLEELLRRRRATIYVSVIERNNQVIVRTGDEKTMEEIHSLVRRLDVPTPLVLLEVKILEVNLGDDFNSVFDYQFSDGVTVAGGFTSGNILPPLSDNPAQWVAPRQRRDSIIAPETSSPWNNSASTDDLTFQFVNDNFRFRMQLLESNNRVTTLATPLLLTANNEVSRIFIGDTEPFTIGFEPPQVVTSGIAQTNIVGTPITELRDVGQLLLITPSINADRTVTLRIAQQQSRKDESGASIPVLDTQGQVQQVAVDTISRETVSGTIVAKDGLSVALGGLIEERADDTRAEVPVVGKLPVLGFFFRRQNTGRTRTETVILVRPYVFNTPCEAAAMSERVVRDASIHPNAHNGRTMLDTHAPWEVVRPEAPCNECENRFRFHNVQPKRF
jgi:general secretion pathway protein D